MEVFEVGQKVSWTIGKFNMIGVVLCNLDENNFEIIVHSRNGSKHVQKTKVNKELLTKIK